MELLRIKTTKTTSFMSNGHYSVFSKKIKKENNFKYYISVFRYKTQQIVKEGLVTELGLQMAYTNYIHS
jgi:hypothetical protein